MKWYHHISQNVSRKCGFLQNLSEICQLCRNVLCLIWAIPKVLYSIIYIRLRPSFHTAPNCIFYVTRLSEIIDQPCFTHQTEKWRWSHIKKFLWFCFYQHGSFTLNAKRSKLSVFKNKFSWHIAKQKFNLLKITFFSLVWATFLTKNNKSKQHFSVCWN